MSTLTSRLGLYKPATTENYNVITDQNNNWDALDAAIGFIPVTSSTRPASAFSGQHIRETDTERLYYSNGSAPVSASWRQVMGVNHTLVASASTGLIYRSRLATGDTQDRFSIDTSGKQSWGSGTAVADVTLARTASASATFTGSLAVTGTGNFVTGLTLAGDPVAVGASGRRIAAGTQNAVFSAVTNVSITINFPAGSFTAAPFIGVQVVSSAGGAVGWTALVTAITSTSATVRIDTVAAFTGTLAVHWQAIQ